MKTAREGPAPARSRAVYGMPDARHAPGCHRQTVLSATGPFDECRHERSHAELAPSRGRVAALPVDPYDQTGAEKRSNSTSSYKAESSSTSSSTERTFVAAAPAARRSSWERSSRRALHAAASEPGRAGS